MGDLPRPGMVTQSPALNMEQVRSPVPVDGSRALAWSSGEEQTGTEQSRTEQSMVVQSRAEQCSGVKCRDWYRVEQSSADQCRGIQCIAVYEVKAIHAIQCSAEQCSTTIKWVSPSVQVSCLLCVTS